MNTMIRIFVEDQDRFQTKISAAKLPFALAAHKETNHARRIRRDLSLSIFDVLEDLLNELFHVGDQIQVQPDRFSLSRHNAINEC